MVWFGCDCFKINSYLVRFSTCVNSLIITLCVVCLCVCLLMYICDCVCVSVCKNICVCVYLLNAYVCVCLLPIDLKGISMGRIDKKGQDYIVVLL